MTTVQISTKHHFSSATPVEEPIEIRIDRGDRYTDRIRALLAWRTDKGTVAYDLSISGVGISESLTNLQSKAIFPGKAVKGWQLEVIAFAAAGLGTISEIR